MNEPVCDKCGCRRFTEHAVHHGQSIRRDCARCRHTLDFPVWYGVAGERPETLDPKVENADEGAEAKAAVRKRRQRTAKPKQPKPKQQSFA